MPPKQSQKQKQKQTVKQSVVVKIGDVSKKRRRRATSKRPAQPPPPPPSSRPFFPPSFPSFPSYPQSAVFQGQGAYVVPPIQPLAGQAVGAIRPEPPRQGQVRIPVKAEPKEVQTEPVEVFDEDGSRFIFDRGVEYGKAMSERDYAAEMGVMKPVDYGRVIRGDVEGMMAKGLNPMTGLPIGAAIPVEENLPKGAMEFETELREELPVDLLNMVGEYAGRPMPPIDRPLFAPPANLDEPPEQPIPQPIGGSVYQGPRLVPRKIPPPDITKTSTEQLKQYLEKPRGEYSTEVVQAELNRREAVQREREAR